MFDSNFLLNFRCDSERNMEKSEPCIQQCLIRRKKKTSGSSRSNDKPWKLETSMSCLKRNTTCNLDQIDESEEKSSVRGILEQVKDKASICDVDDDDDSDDVDDGDDEHSLASLTTSNRAGSKQKTTDDAQADYDGSSGSSSSALKPRHWNRFPRKIVQNARV